MAFITAQNERTLNGIPLDAYQAPLGEAMGAAFDQATYDNPTNQLQRFAERYRADQPEIVTDPLTGEVVSEGEAPKRLDRETAKARIAEAGIKYEVPEDGISEKLLELIIRDKREALRREQILARAPGGVVSGSLQFAAALGASILDPLNVASAFIPVVPQARVASMLTRAGTSTLARAGARAQIGAIEGAVGQAMLEPLMAYSAMDDQIDYTALDTLRNIAFGAAIGSTLHVGLGGVRDRFFPAARPLIETDLEPTSAAAIVSRMNPETHQAAMKAAVAQSATGRVVDVDAVVRLDPAPEPGESLYRGVKTVGQESSRGVVYTTPDRATAAAYAGGTGTILDLSLAKGNELDLSGLPSVADLEDVMRLLAAKVGESRAQRALLHVRTNSADQLDTYTVLRSKDAVDALREAGVDVVRFKQLTGDDGVETVTVAVLNKDLLQEAGAPRGMADAQPAPRDLSGVRAAANRSVQPEASRAVDMRAAADAEAQLAEAPKSYDLEAAQKELTEAMDDLKATAEQLGMEPGLKAFDDQLKRANQYEKALEAAAVCGARG